MSIEFKRHEFLEFFDNESLTFFDEEKYVENYTYTIDLENGFKFLLNMLPIEQKLSITLRHASAKCPLFDLDFEKHDIDKISLSKEQDATFLNIYKVNGDNYPYRDKSLDTPYMKIRIKPSVTIQLSL
ncbi:MAG: hypothetical protein P4L31_06135 [Candidatus Babeliales bacterium]|nr:hypothetical protein [Candidatus Babeliales bacterium]